MDALQYLKTKYKLDFDQPSPIEIEGVGRLDLVRWIKELNMKTGAEIGVERARFSHIINDNNAQLKLYGIDPYEKYEAYREYRDQPEMDAIYKEMLFNMRLAIKMGAFVPIRKKSMDALADFEDNSLDFVYIDGNHEADYPYQDIKEWAKKVRPGGIVAGHDYVRIERLDFTIKDALKRYTEETNIHPWFILGSYQVRTAVVRDRSRSWMFVK